MKSTSGSSDTPALHVAIIMDGNGRWAAARGLPRVEGHRRGAAAIRSVAGAAPGLGIRTLTLYAFSVDNWKRPRPEVGRLMGSSSPISAARPPAFATRACGSP